MPYNNTPVPPPKETTGQVSLPLARIKKIINVDDDVHNCSNNAAFVITIATEMFIQHLTERAYEMVKSEKRPRKNLQYQDVANAVARIDNLEFLSDVVPRTTTYRKYVEQRGKNFKPGDSVTASKAAAAGQPESSTGMPSRPTPLIDILHPAESMGGATRHQQQDDDEMDVDTDLKAPTGPEPLEMDPVQEQLATEMGRSTNGRL